ncbi:MAG TPA: response regulator transcription factor [Clostridia bacterium]|nr:response regulator transcription factor [Clostridia bacterium]
MTRILVVEDESHLAQGLRFNLEAEGYEVRVLETGEAALKLLLQDADAVDVVVLDIMLPGINGFTVASELRKAKQFVPVLMLTARGRPEDVLKGFESGADDYLPKPFDLAILLARVNSLLRRREWTAPGPRQEPDDAATPVRHADVFKFAEKVVDFDRLQLSAAGQVFQLTLMEAELLRFLIRNSGVPVSRKQILEQVWDLHEDTDTRAIDNFIVRLRRYIEDEPGQPKHLLTVRGVGYKFLPEGQ